MDCSRSEYFKQLTWSDIQAWAGDTITSRGRSYQRSHAVQDLALMPNGALVAWVQGTERYATIIDIEAGKITSMCSCPYGGTCKHAVAVVLEYLEQLKNNIKVPAVTEEDKRLALLKGGIENDRVEESEPTIPASSEPFLGQIRSYLEKQSQPQLVALLVSLSERDPEARKFLTDCSHLSSGKIEKLVAAARKEIDRLSAEPAWSNSWNDDGYIPDYSKVKNRLEMLLSKGYADEVITLGKRLLEVGTRQVEESNDGGETADEISSCLEIVFLALPQSRLSPSEQMLWVVEAELSDEYDLTSGAASFWEQQHQIADWNILADTLLKHLNSLGTVKGEDRFSMEFRRDRLTDWIILALENAGRQEEIIPLCQKEASKTQSYVRLVDRLLDASRCTEAEQWIREGIKVTQKSSPGIASRLKKILIEMREKAGDWLSVATFRVEDFFADPDSEAFQALGLASEKAGVWPAVRAAAIQYLETAKLPTAPSWPLPYTGVTVPVKTEQREFPMVETLIEIAIVEKQSSEVIRWYDYYLSHRRKVSGFGTRSWLPEDRIAEAIAEAFPERAIAIWKKLAESQIAQTQPGAYQQAAVYLTNMRRLSRQTRKEEEWKSYIAGLRSANIRKRRLLEVLDGLTGKPIIET
jgi:uncharacterized Zn finger protein